MVLVDESVVGTGVPDVVSVGTTILEVEPDSSPELVSGTPVVAVAVKLVTSVTGAELDGRLSVTVCVTNPVLKMIVVTSSDELATTEEL